MEVSLDFSFINGLLGLSPLTIAWIIFIRGGWIPFAFLIGKFTWDFWVLNRQGKFAATIEYILLAIDVPKDSEQSPKAMEQVFATVTGAHSPLNAKEKYLYGKFQMPFSWEIISIDGYIQFLVRAPKVFRDLVEASIQAHYPDAEITEVHDYTEGIPKSYPNDRYNIWGSEVELVANEAFPLRTYESFEHTLSGELKDPLAGLLETMSHVRKGEQVWLQFITVPTENSEWVKRALRQAYKIAGKKVAAPKGWVDKWMGPLHNFPQWFPWTRTDVVEEQKKLIEFEGIFNLTPGERSRLEGIENKASKLGYICKIRLVYLSPPEQYQSQRVVSAVFGAIKQFGDLTSNSLRPNKRTRTQIGYFFINWRIAARRRRIVTNYINRSWYAGSKFFILNVEELATLYHFPEILVKTSTVKRTEVKKSEAPVDLPRGETERQTGAADIRDELARLQLDNDYYERRYAKDLSLKKTPTSKKPARTTDVPHDPSSGAGTAGVPDNLPLA